MISEQYHKLEDRSKPCVFIGYSLTQSAYLCLDPTTGRMYTSHHVQFDEYAYPFRTMASPKAQASARHSKVIHGTTSPAFIKVSLVQLFTHTSSGPHLPTSSQTSAPAPAPSQVLPSSSHSSTSSTTSTYSPSLSPTDQPTNPNQPTQSTQSPTCSTNVTTSTTQRLTGQVSNPPAPDIAPVAQPP